MSARNRHQPWFECPLAKARARMRQINHEMDRVHVLRDEYTREMEKMQAYRDELSIEYYSLVNFVAAGGHND